MKIKKYFPFGSELTKVEQKSRSQKDYFILGVYASAVHARWVDKKGKQKVTALAVASEPEIFWKGENAEEIISSIQIPEEMGRLTLPSNKNMNGPSGNSLDKYYLKPLDIKRENAWLSDLLPEARLNKNQVKALEKHYSEEVIKRYGLQPVSIPHFDKKELDSDKRRNEILRELETSNAHTLILLGDLPIKWFLRCFSKKKYHRLSQFGDKKDTYGKKHSIDVNGKNYEVLPLCHPRQAGRLGYSNSKWGLLHDNWVKNTSSLIG